MISGSSYNRDNASSNVYEPVRQYGGYRSSYARRDNDEETLTIKELPNDVNETNRGEVVPYNKDASKRACKNQTDYVISSSRMKITAIEANESENVSDSEDKDKNISIIWTQEILRDVDEITEEDQGRQDKRATPYVTVTVGKLRLRTLIDTGSQISLITKDIYDKITDEGTAMQIIPIKKFSLVGAFSDRGQIVANRVQFSFCIEGKDFSHELYVVKNLLYEMILGMDFLSERLVTH